MFELQFNDDSQLREFFKENGGGMLSIVDDTVSPTAKGVRTYDALVHGSIYCLHNGYYTAVLNGRTRAQVEASVLESQVALAMVNDIGNGAHVHPNVKFVDKKTKKDIAEIDSVVVVHVGGEDVPDSVAYVIECALSPQVKDVKLLLDKVEVFQLHAPSLPHFRSVETIVPVLGGKMWSDEAIQECKARSETCVSRGMRPILRIQPSGKDFKVIRGFSTFARTLLKRL